MTICVFGIISVLFNPCGIIRLLLKIISLTAKKVKEIKKRKEKKKKEGRIGMNDVSESMIYASSSD
jgi:hypothetical protein